MEANHQKPTSLLVMSLSIALVGSVMFDIYKNRIEYDHELENTTANAKVDSLSLVKEKLSRDVETAAGNLQKKAEKMQNIIRKYNEITASIEEKTVLLNEFKSKNAELRAWGRDKNDQISLLNNQIVDLKTMKNKLEQEIGSIPQLEKTVVVYKTRNDSLETRQVEKEKEVARVSEELSDTKNLLTADRFRVEVLTGNEHVTAKAKKGKRLHITMMLPDYLRKQLKENEVFYVSILDEHMQPVDGFVGEIPSSQEYLQKHTPVKYHATQSATLSQNQEEIEFIFPIYKRLNPGIYVAKFHSTQQYLGSVGFKLKDSFLFF